MIKPRALTDLMRPSSREVKQPAPTPAAGRAVILDSSGVDPTVSCQTPDGVGEYQNAVRSRAHTADVESEKGRAG